MKQGDKELLLKDLCARLPYNVVINCTEEDDEKTNFNCFLAPDMIKDIKSETAYWIIKPYLRPMTSMSEKEKKELGRISCEGNIEHKYGIFYRSQDYLNSIHVDYRGLIEKGLAIEVTEENNPYKE